MTHLESQPNAQFWQALENYIRGRIVEQAAEKPAEKPEPKCTCGHHDSWHRQFGGCFCGCKKPPKPAYEEEGDEAWEEYQHIKQSIFPDVA